MFLLRRPSRPQSSAGGKVTLPEANVKVIRLEGGRPWGFKIAGGAEVNKPILITKIDPAGQAANFAINEGDMITSVNGVSLKYFVTRKEAVHHIKRAGSKIVMEIQSNPQSNWAGRSSW